MLLPARIEPGTRFRLVFQRKPVVYGCDPATRVAMSAADDLQKKLGLRYSDSVARRMVHCQRH